MPRINYLNEKTVVTDAAVTILQTSLQNGIPHTHVCGGNARCSTCRVLVLEGLQYCCPRNDKEQKMAARRNFSPRVRLACQTTLNGDITLRRLVIDEEDKDLVVQEMMGLNPRSVGEERRIAILFSDVRNFTSFAEKHLPYDIIHVLNRYFNRVGAVILQHGGQIDNFIGDGIMALFGMHGEPDAALNAVRAGRAMLAEVAMMQAYFLTQFQSDFRIGIGIHYGEAVLGVLGVGERRRLTAIGDAVNFASRIESANKVAGTELLISEDVDQQIKGRVRIGRHTDLPIKGKTGQYSLHEVLDVSEAPRAALPEEEAEGAPAH